VSRAREATDRAARWILLQEDHEWTNALQEEFESWMAASDGNKAAYWRLKRGWTEADRINALGPEPAAIHMARRRRGGGRWWLPAAAAASIAAAIGAQLMLAHRAPRPVATMTSYVTPSDGRQVVGLEDGSNVEINESSRVRVAVSERRREVWLDDGEAYFEVKHIDGRPFLVHAGNRQVTVLGTKFVVRRDGDTVAVTVVEGRVRMDTVGGAQRMPPVVIVSGDTALARGLSTLVTEQSGVQAERTRAWRQGMLKFDQTRLSEVAAEFNRYNPKPLIVIGAEAASVRISGVFPANSPDAFVRLLRDAYGFKIDETPDAIKISS
jgi:transmembrane sensor